MSVTWPCRAVGTPIPILSFHSQSKNYASTCPLQWGILLFINSNWKEKKKEREREGERETHTQRQRQRNRDREREEMRQTDRQTETHTERNEREKLIDTPGEMVKEWKRE